MLPLRLRMPLPTQPPHTHTLSARLPLTASLATSHLLLAQSRAHLCSVGTPSSDGFPRDFACLTGAVSGSGSPQLCQPTLLCRLPLRLCMSDWRCHWLTPTLSAHLALPASFAISHVLLSQLLKHCNVILCEKGSQCNLVEDTTMHAFCEGSR